VETSCVESRKIDNAIISFPRSGTDFFCEALTRDRHIRYFREYFNPLCNPKRESQLSAHFGDERTQTHLNIMREIAAEDFDATLANTWRADRYNTTKENFSATRVAHFARHFNIVMLTRRLYHTFPTSRPDFIVPIFHSFLLAGEYRSIAPARELNELRHYLCKDVHVADYRHAGILAYIVQHYILLFEAARMAAPVIVYEDLIALPRPALEQALACLTNFGAAPATVAAALEKSRTKKKHRTDLAARRARFFAEHREDWYAGPLRFVLGLSPDLAPLFARHVFDPAEAP
jgi:hypothetical protein